MWFLHRKVLYTKNNLARRNQQDRKGVDFFIKMSQSNMVYYVRTSKSCLYKKSSYVTCLAKWMYKTTQFQVVTDLDLSSYFSKTVARASPIAFF
jgi:predicted phosphatase